MLAPDQARALREMVGVTKPGGRVLIDAGLRDVTVDTSHEQRADIVRVLDGMIRERSRSDGTAVLTAPLNIGVGTKYRLGCQAGHADRRCGRLGRGGGTRGDEFGLGGVG
jgi:hypothetical protein